MSKKTSKKSIEVFYGTSSAEAEELIDYLVMSEFNLKDLPPHLMARTLIVTPNRVEIEIKGGVVVTIAMKRSRVSLIVENNSRKGQIKV